MTEMNFIGNVDDIPPGSSRRFDVDDSKVAVFNIGGHFHAIADACPHRGASLASGAVVDSVVSCPLHGWQFDLETGECLSQPGSQVARYSVSVEEGRLLLERPTELPAPPENNNGIHQYLVRYGTLGWVALFGSIERIECEHKSRVVIHTSRGIEMGEFLSSPSAEGTDHGNTNGEKPTGEFLRRATAEDERLAAEMIAEPSGLFDECHRLLAERDLPIEVVEFERLLDGETTVLYFLGEQVPELEAVAAQLTEMRGSKIQFFPVIEPPPTAGGGCGSGNCGNGQCGQG